MIVTEKLANRRFAELERIFAGGKASHAYLFLGPLNAENETGIRRLAQTLLCEGEREKPCGRCRTCRLMEQGSHPDFRVLAPEGGKIKLEEVRQLCYDALLNPYLSAGKVYFFQQFELLTEVAANAFLKTLEEPPPAVYFLALAEDERGVLPTIRSRMHRVQLGGAGLEGSFPENNGVDLPVSDLGALLRQAEQLSSTDRNQVDLYLQGLQAHFRAALLAAAGAGTATKGLIGANAAVQQARAYVAANLNLRLLLEDLFLTLYEELGDGPRH
jgi:DNA polymerase III delta prime subunit